MERTSDRGRIARKADEARPAEPEKAVKKTTASRSRAPAKPARLKVVWEVCSGSGKAVKTYPYPDKAAAEAQTKALTWTTGRAHTLRATKVPME